MKMRLTPASLGREAGMKKAGRSQECRARKKSTRRLLVLTIAFLVAMVPALSRPSVTYAAPTFSFSTIDAGGTATDAFGLNTAGQIAGTVYFNSYCDDYGCYASSPHGFLVQSGTFTIIDVPDANETSALGINGSGQIVGRFSDATGTHGFLRIGDTFTAIEVPGASGTYAVGINGTGQIVGVFWDATRTHGFLKDGDAFTTIDVPGASSDASIQVSGINDSGQIVGFLQTATTTHGFLKDGETFTAIDVPGAYGTAAVGITNTGQIVGWFVDVTGYHGFLKDGDTFTTINVPGATHTWASGIDDAGQIVGSFLVDSLPSLSLGFLAVPTGNNNAPPVASFTSACGGLVCSFNGSNSSDADGTITSYVWSFGDGTLASGVTVSHAYAVAGAYTVTLTVTDNAGAIGTQSQGVTAVNAPPIASFTSACSGLACTFDGSGSSDPDGTITNYAWNFGDGTTGSGATASHTYAGAGIYTVTLIATDNGGATGAQSKAMVIQAFMHVGDLDRAVTNQGSMWTAIATTTVHDSSHSPVANAAVSGSWSTGGTGSCTTNGSGQCAVSRAAIPKNTKSAIFTVTNVTHATLTYKSPDNHDPDGDSNGTTITVNRP